MSKEGNKNNCFLPAKKQPGDLHHVQIAGL